MNSPAKTWWKALHRLLRVNRKEIEKTELDLLVYGQAGVEIGSDGMARHVPVKELLERRGESQ